MTPSRFSVLQSPVGLLLALGMLAASTATAQPPLSPSVLAGSSGILVLGESGALELLEPATGELVWRRPSATRPLLEANGLIWALARSEHPEGDLKIVALDAGGRTVSTITAEVPSRAWTSVHDALGKSFEIRAGVDATGAPIVYWRSTEQRIKGARAAMMVPDSPGSDPRLLTPAPSLVQVEQGSFRVEPTSGTTVALDPAETAALLKAQTGGGSAMVKAQAGVLRYLSSDGRHLLISERIADDRQWEKYRWRVMDRHTGNLVAERKSHVAWSPFQIHGSLLLVQERPWQRRGDGSWLSAPFQLRAFDPSGVEQWRYTLRDTRFVGPYPS